MKTTFIYCLKDPDTKEIRYIGKTNSPKERLWGHLCEGKYNRQRNYKCNWIQSLLKNGKKPILEIIEEIPFDEWEAKEIYWIGYYRTLNNRLVNSKTGGISGKPLFRIVRPKYKTDHKPTGRPKGYKQSEETRLKIKEKRAKQIITDVHKANIGLGTKGRVHSEDTKKKMSEAALGKKQSDEHRKRGSISKCRKIKEISPDGTEFIWNGAQEPADFYRVTAAYIRKSIYNPNRNSKVKSKFYYINN